MRIRKGRLARPRMEFSQLKMYESPNSSGDQSHRNFAAEEGSCGNNSADENGAPLALLEKLQNISSMIIPSERPYMNLDEFVTSLARKNCFPADDQDSDDQHNITRESSSSLINFSVQYSDDEESQDFGRLRLFGAEGLHGDIAAVETSVCLGMSSHEKIGSHPYNKPANLSVELELPTTQQEMEAVAGQTDQTMKSSTESMEQQRSGRHTRVSSSTGGTKRGCVQSPMFHDEQNLTDDTADASSDYSESSRRAKSKKKKKKKQRALISVSSSSSLGISHGTSEKRKQKIGQLRAGGKPATTNSKRNMIKTKKQKEQRTGGARSGRPKKLKYLKQENVEELGNQCNRRDGKGWTCPLLAKPGYQLCDHHLDKLRCKPGSRSKYNKTKKKVPATRLIST